MIVQLVSMTMKAGAGYDDNDEISFSIEEESRCNALLQYCSDVSIPIKRRCSFHATSVVVPAPLNGSSTISFLYENSFIRRRGNSSGNIAG